MRGVALRLALLASALTCALACAHTYTHSRGGRVLAQAAPCTFNHARAGRDWPADDRQCGWTCSGRSQSPINLPSTRRTTPLRSEFKANLKFGLAINSRVLNLGSVVQVEFNKPRNSQASVVYFGDSIYTLYNASSLSAGQARRVRVEPLQFHFHSTSEHLLSGRSTQLELHLVTKLIRTPGVPLPRECSRPDQVCLAVFGAMYDLVTDPDARRGDPIIQEIINLLPKRCPQAGRNCITFAPQTVFQLEDLFPRTQSYYTYTGSLTTPPCSEGVMWHVFPAVKRTLTERQALDLQVALATANLQFGEEERNRLSNRETQPRNGRTVFFSP